MSDARETFAGKFRRWMSDHNITHLEMSLRLDVDKTQVGRWASGQATPRLDMLAKICDVTGMSADELLGRKGDNDAT